MIEKFSVEPMTAKLMASGGIHEREPESRVAVRELAS
jgi:hypothetical protein